MSGSISEFPASEWTSRHCLTQPLVTATTRASVGSAVTAASLLEEQRSPRNGLTTAEHSPCSGLSLYLPADALSTSKGGPARASFRNHHGFTHLDKFEVSIHRRDNPSDAVFPLLAGGTPLSWAPMGPQESERPLAFFTTQRPRLTGPRPAVQPLPGARFLQEVVWRPQGLVPTSLTTACNFRGESYESASDPFTEKNSSCRVSTRI